MINLRQLYTSLRGSIVKSPIRTQAAFTIVTTNFENLSTSTLSNCSRDLPSPGVSSMSNTRRKQGKAVSSTSAGKIYSKAPASTKLNDDDYHKHVLTLNLDDVIFFWRETEQDYGWLSQWYPCPFSDNDGNVFATAEHYMMYQKAILFRAHDIANYLISKAGQDLPPREVKAKGRTIPNFDQNEWNSNRREIVERGSYLKFTRADPDREMLDPRLRLGGGLKKMLLDTGDRELVEASPFDSIWGIGMTKQQALSSNRNWGHNFLGRALFDARQKIRQEMQNSEQKPLDEERKLISTHKNQSDPVTESEQTTDTKEDTENDDSNWVKV